MVTNLSGTDRAVRVIIGVMIAAAAVVVRTHSVAAIILLLTGLAFIVGATVGF